MYQASALPAICTEMERAGVEYTPDQMRYLRLLQRQFPTIEAADSERINLRAILNLPKGTEHFLSDLHGEHEAFSHILRNASGVIRRKIDDLFQTCVSDGDRDRLATLVYYPEEKLELLHQQGKTTPTWYRETLLHLLALCREIGSKYTRSKVRKALPPAYAYIIDELLNFQAGLEEKTAYHDAILDAILETGSADDVICALAHTISRLAIDQLHIIGDIFDRGPGAHRILEDLRAYHQVDIQWGNHDILWMGAAAGSPVCMLQVIVNCAKYDNLDTLEEGYGISLRHLSAFANHTYGQEYQAFIPTMHAESPSDADIRYTARLHKTAVILLLKLEHQLILRRPEFAMEHRLVLQGLNLQDGTVTLEGKTYPLRDSKLLTMKEGCCWELTPEEQEVVERLSHAFRHSEKLQEHVRFLYQKGSMYLRINGNLLYHGCIPMNADGTFTVTTVCGEPLSGRAYIDRAEQIVRQGYFGQRQSAQRAFALDFFWYLWCGPHSPLFGRKKMATFERYFLDDTALHEEEKDPYYAFVRTQEHAQEILREFGLPPETGHIINGHVPVQVRKGESPVKAGGRLFVIDGGLSKAYQKKTGIAGYTLIFDSREIQLVSHEPFCPVAEAVRRERDIHSTLAYREACPSRLRVADTDGGASLREKIQELSLLTEAYRQGVL